MIKTLKTIFAVAVSFSIVTISSAFADMGAIKKWSDGEFSLSVLSAKDREKEQGLILEVNSMPGFSGIEKANKNKGSLTTEILKHFKNRDNWT